MAKKRGKFNWSTKLALTLLLLSTILVATLLVGALTPGVAPNPGHDIQTVSPPSPCSNNQVLQFIDPAPAGGSDGYWVCVNLPSSGQARITNGLTECLSANKSIKTIDPDTGVVTCETDDFGSGGGVTLNPNVYTATATDFDGILPTIVNLGSHAFCFLTRIKEGTYHTYDFDCELTESGGTWTLKVRSANTNPGTTCSARCVD